MSQQKYIYQPQTLSSIEALYSDPETLVGFTTIQETIASKQLNLDRAVSDKLILPYSEYEIQLRPSELVTSASIYNIIGHLHDNFMYLNTRATVASNVIPGNYTGYYWMNTGTPSFSANGALPARYPPAVPPGTESIRTVNDEHPLLSNSNEPLNDLKSGAFVRDNSLISVNDIAISGNTSYHYGFLASTDTLTVVRMTANQQADQPWEIIDEYKTAQDLPGTIDETTPNNTIKYSNIVKVKSDNEKNIYILDKGTIGENLTPGIANISSDSTRSTLYKYDVTGYITPGKDNLVQKNRRMLTTVLGDLNKPTNESDILDPVAFTVRDNGEIILYDEYDYTFKRFDGIGNYIGKHAKRSVFFRGAPGTRKTYLGMSDIHFDETTKTLYVLCPNGSIFTFDEQFNLKDSIFLTRKDSNQSSTITSYDLDQRFYTDRRSPGHANNEKFIQLEFSKNEDNVYYVISSNRVIKRFKTRPDYSIGNFDFLGNGLGNNIVDNSGTISNGYRVYPLFCSVLQEGYVVTKDVVGDDGYVSIEIDDDRTYLYDQIYMYCGFVNAYDVVKMFSVSNLEDYMHDFSDGINGERIRSLISFKERDNYRSCLIDNEYPIYEITDTTGITHKEYSSDLVYNKLMHKLLANHTKMIELINYRLQSLYTKAGEMIFDKRVYLEEREYRDLILDIDDNYYVGINEYLSTGTVNRCFKKLYQVQQSILDILQMTTGNHWPSRDVPTQIKAYLHTDGTEFVDIDKKPYTGYYYIRTQPDGDLYITGQDPIDGTRESDGSPTSDRYLEPIS